MIIIGADILARLLAGELYDIKMVFNERGAILFSSQHQHRDMKAEGISYEDNYAGNAMAAMVRKEAIEIRFHQRFKDAAVAGIIRRMLALPELSGLGCASVTYQGRTISSKQLDSDSFHS